MYVINQRSGRKKTILKYLMFSAIFLAIVAILVWLIFFKSRDNSASFVQPNAEPAAVKPEMRDFENEYFKISLPATWAELGRQNPFAYEVYYEFQNTQKDYENRWLRVYVDVIPATQAVTKILPVAAANNRLVPEQISDNCRTFNGAPVGSGQTISQTWLANWQGIDFYCNMNSAEYFIGTASPDEGYGVTLNNLDGSQHRYFIAYIDHNNNPDYNFLIDVVNTFETR
jgi:hypothetical protein